MKIFIGTNDIAGILTGLKQGFESIGCEVTTLVKDTHPFFKQEYDYEILRAFPNSHSLKNKFIRKSIEYVDYNIQNLRIKKNLDKLINDHDVFIFIWQSLQKNYSDYHLIKKANKKIINVFVGSDIRHISAFQQEFGGDQSSWERGFHLEDINVKLNALRNAELYSDLILSVPDQSGLSIRPYDHMYIPFDSNKITYKISKNKTIKIIHAPSRSGIKGTEIIIKTIERIKSEGISLDFKLLQNVSNKQVIEELMDADILVDELHLHGPGMLGLEAMASGCSVATHSMSIHKNIFDPPVCNINEKNIYEQLKFLITNKEYRSDLIRQGKIFVDEKNAPSTIAKSILDKINSTKIQHNYNPEFFLNKYQLPLNSKISMENLELTRKVLLNYGVSKQENIKRAIEEKLIPAIDENICSRIPIWP